MDPRIATFCVPLNNKSAFFPQAHLRSFESIFRGSAKARWEQQCPAHQLALNRVWPRQNGLAKNLEVDPRIFPAYEYRSYWVFKTPLRNADFKSDSDGFPYWYRYGRSFRRFKQHTLTRNCSEEWSSTQTLTSLEHTRYPAELTRITWTTTNNMETGTRIPKLKVVNDIQCREFIHKAGPSHRQQLIPPSLVPRVLKSFHSSPTGGQLEKFKTVEKVRERFYWPGFQEDNKLFINRCEQCQKEPTHQRPIDFLWLKVPRITLSITLASTSWAPYLCQSPYSFDRRSFLEVVRSNPTSWTNCSYNSYGPSQKLDLSFWMSP